MDKSLNKRIGKAARKARVSLGMTQEDVAERIGVSVEFYSRIERGTASPSLRKLMALALLFGTSTDHLLGLTEEATALDIGKQLLPAPPEDVPELKRFARRVRKTNHIIARAVSTVANTTLTTFEDAIEKITGDKSALKRKKKRTRRPRKRKTQEDAGGQE